MKIVARLDKRRKWAVYKTKITVPRAVVDFFQHQNAGRIAGGGGLPHHLNYKKTDESGVFNPETGEKTYTLFLPFDIRQARVEPSAGINEHLLETTGVYIPGLRQLNEPSKQLLNSIVIEVECLGSNITFEASIPFDIKPDGEVNENWWGLHDWEDQSIRYAFRWTDRMHILSGLLQGTQTVIRTETKCFIHGMFTFKKYLDVIYLTPVLTKLPEKYADYM